MLVMGSVCYRINRPLRGPQILLPQVTTPTERGVDLGQFGVPNPVLSFPLSVVIFKLQGGILEERGFWHFIAPIELATKRTQ